MNEQLKKSILDSFTWKRRKECLPEVKWMKKFFVCLMASLHDDLMIMWCEILSWISKVSIEN